MKFGVHAGLWMARWTDELAPIVKMVADLGFDGVEVSLLDMSDEKTEALGRPDQRPCDRGYLFGWSVGGCRYHIR